MKPLFSLSVCALLLASAAKAPVSFSDNLVFPEFCKASLEEFSDFRRAPLARLFWENLTYEEGANYLASLKTSSPEIFARRNSCCKNDQIGNPIKYQYKEFGIFSASSLRYLKFAGDLSRHLGSLEGLKVVEIGGGYGGQCAVLSSLFSLPEYAIVDLPSSLELQRKYLSKLAFEHTRFHSVNALPSLSSDLILSYLAFGELDRTVQKALIEKLFSRTNAAYLVLAPAHWKEIPYSQTEHKRVKPYPKERLVALFEKQGFCCQELAEDLPTGKGHYVLKLTRKEK